METSTNINTQLLDLFRQNTIEKMIKYFKLSIQIHNRHNPKKTT